MISVRRLFLLAQLVATLAVWGPTACLAQEKSAAAEPAIDAAQAAASESKLLAEIRQLTFEGRRAGEGYFSQDGSRMVFQSEREPGNPFFQIYVLDFETGDQVRVSPGVGKTTCAWIHPSGEQVLFASTHDDPEAKQKQQEELELRASGKERRYSWDYDEHFELYSYDVPTGEITRITNAVGYDAEGSWSPDGKQIVFASNRAAYQRELTEREQTHFDMDKAYMMDLYIMNADGSGLKQLTDAPGYDGGPFFSPDGKSICWRRFSENGATAEIMTMNVDGSNQKQLTNMQAMSWAPYYHPSGEYLIYATNVHGFANFELYMIDVKGRHAPVRVTYTDGFDGLPVFHPDGQRIAWTTNRTSQKQSQIFMARWDHEAARQLLQLDENASEPEAVSAAAASIADTVADFSPQDILRHVDYLCRPELGGRMTGTRGERLATSYVAAYFDSLGLEPAGENGSWFQEFEFTAGAKLGPDNELARGDQQLKTGEDWIPLAFSRSGAVEQGEVVFAGYGIRAPAAEGQEEYDSFVHLDVKDKWVLALRFLPEDVTAERRQHLSRYSSLRYKAMQARDLGARGLILATGPRTQVREQLPPLRFDGAQAGTSIPVLMVTNDVAKTWVATAGKDLVDLQEKLDVGRSVMGFALEDVAVSASIDVQGVRRTGRNVLARLPSVKAGHEPAIIIGAHIDHLGTGPNSSSLAKDEERDGVHWGADDNASGVASMLEIAEYLSDQVKSGKLQTRRDILFAAWSGEELGLIGSDHFAKQRLAQLAHHAHSAGAGDHGPKDAADHEPAAKTTSSTDAAAANPHAANPHADGPVHAAPKLTLASYLSACLNLDMVGRLEKKLVLQGVGSSSIWKREIERRNAAVGLPITLQEDSYLPTDASVFFRAGVPILSAFTGSHSDYHTPRDTPDKLNYEGAAKIARLMGLIARSLALDEEEPDYVEQAAPKEGERRANLRAYLGTIPDYAEEGVKGVLLSGVSKSGPAAEGGVRGGDVIVELAGRKIENIYDYTYAIEALKIGETIKVVVRRGGEKIELQVTPGSRD